VRLLEVDEAEGAMLLERIQPGIPVETLQDDEESTRIAAHVMQQIRHSPQQGGRYRTVEGWATRGMRNLRAEFDGGTGPFPRRLVEQAEAIFAELVPSMEEQVVLHGDLHHWNILSAGERGWLVIDPKGVVGEPAYETGAWLRNPNTTLLSLPDPGATLARRIAIFTEELGFERERIRNWAIAQAILSAWWSYEDRTGGEEFGIEVAEILAKLLP
jgi:streptomycin 6-kinase